jgi:hypothetical protein
MWTADDVGESFVLLTLVFLGAALIRKWSSHLRALFLPTAVIGGFLALELGPEGLGRLTHSNGIFPDQTFAFWLNYAINSPSIPIARQNPTAADEDLDIDHHLPRPVQEPMDEWQGMSQVTAAAMALGVSIALGFVLLELVRWIFGCSAQIFREVPALSVHGESEKDMVEHFVGEKLDQNVRELEQAVATLRQAVLALHDGATVYVRGAY